MAGSNGLRPSGSYDPTRPALAIPPGEKAALFYHRLEDVCGAVAELLKDSVRQGEMCQFLFRAPLSVVKENLRAKGLDLDAEPSIEVIPLSQALMDHYSRSNFKELMRKLMERAKGLGYAGVRIIVNVPEEMAVQVSTESVWLELDRERGEMGITMVSLYDMTVLSPGFLLRSLAAYPLVIMDGVLCRNFYYMPNLAEPRKESYHDLYEQLDNIREDLNHRESEEQERSKLMEMNRRLQEEIVQRKMVEFALLRAENNLRTMLDAVSDSVFIIDRDKRVTMGNNTFLRYLEGMGSDTSYEGKPIHELFPGIPPGGHRLFEEVFRGGYSIMVDESVDYKGARMNMEVRLVPVMMGDKVDRIVVISRNIAVGTKEIEAVWADAEALKNEVLDPCGPMSGKMESYPHPVMMTDTEWNIQSVNRPLAGVMGCSMEDIVSMGNSQSFLSARKYDDGLVHRVDIDGRISAPCVMKRKDGSFLDVMCYVTFINKGGRPGAITIIRPDH